VKAAQTLDEKLHALREQFDRSFAVAAAEGGDEHLDFLAIRIAGDFYALRLSELASLHADRKLVPAPSLLPELLGIAGFRGVLTPVYDLAALLGYRAEPAGRWLVVARGPAPVAFAFGAFDAHLRVPPDRVSLAQAEANRAVDGAVHDGHGALPLLHLASLVEGILQRIKAHGPSQER
jgi:chemotaxis signal transduction protein